MRPKVRATTASAPMINAPTSATMPETNSATLDISSIGTAYRIIATPAAASTTLTSTSNRYIQATPTPHFRNLHGRASVSHAIAGDRCAGDTDQRQTTALPPDLARPIEKAELARPFLVARRGPLISQGADYGL